MTPYLLVFALVCLVLSYGLWHRRAWMWPAGWIMLYLFGAYFGRWFFSALAWAETSHDIAFSTVYFAGGLLVWLPAASWWANHRDEFGPVASRKPAPGQGDADLPPPA
jgi:hypothetical protein